MIPSINGLRKHCVTCLFEEFDSYPPEDQKTVDPPYRKRQVLTEHMRKMERYNILRLKSELSGPLVAYVKCDLDENRLRGLLRNVKNFSNSGEYSVFSGSYYGKHVSFLGTGRACEFADRTL